MSLFSNGIHTVHLACISSLFCFSALSGPKHVAVAFFISNFEYSEIRFENDMQRDR